MADRPSATARILAGIAQRSLLAKVGAAVVAGAALALAAAAMLLAWLAALAGAGDTTTGCGPAVPVSAEDVPGELVPVFTAAADHYRLGPDGPAILAALTAVESDFGKNMGPSSAGAIGFTQFMPGTWRKYGVDANADGSRDPYDPVDAIHSSANYLRASGAPANWRRALFAYNHADWYVRRVLERAAKYSKATTADALPIASCAPPQLAEHGNARRITGGGRIVAIPGFPGEQIDERLLADLGYLVHTYRVAVTDGYAPSGHKAAGEHPLGLAVDLVPGPGGTWDDIDRLAAWAEPEQDQPRPPFRWVGYTGDRDHGRGDHLHLSWQHGPAPGHEPPAEWVLVLAGASP